MTVLLGLAYHMRKRDRHIPQVRYDLRRLHKRLRLVLLRLAKGKDIGWSIDVAKCAVERVDLVFVRDPDAKVRWWWDTLTLQHGTRDQRQEFDIDQRCVGWIDFDRDVKCWRRHHRRQGVAGSSTGRTRAAG
jgi:hypothetical protein